MLNEWLCVFVQSCTGPVFGFAMDSMQMVKENAPPKWVRIGTWLILSILCTLYNIFGKDSPADMNYLSLPIFFSGAVVSFRFFYKTSFLRQLSITLILIMAIGSAELVIVPIMWLLRIPTISFDYSHPDMLLTVLVGSFVSNVILFFVAVLWRRFKLQRRMPRSSWVFVILPLCLVAPTLVYMEQIQQTGGMFSLLHVFSMTGAFLLNMLLIFVQFNQAEKDEAEKELAELKHQTELERQYYESVEARREEMAKIRHDYNNHLSSVLGLMHMGKPDEAEKVLESLLAKVEQTEDCQEKRSFSMEEDEC